MTKDNFDWEKENPLLTCKCGRKFRKHNWDKSKTYHQCMSCTIADWNRIHERYGKKTVVSEFGYLGVNFN